jgi:glucuronoarabinoxylan endo-1,4-beta-xylanase
VTIAAATSGSGTPSSSEVVANTSDVHQRIDGFGASDKYATLSDAQADLLFSQTSGIGLSILRVAVSPSATDISTYANAQKAAARGAIVWASPWSPPAQWKDNGSTGNGGHLLTADYDAWATSLAGFASTMQQNGVTLYGISAQNEPDYTATWDSCLYSSDQMVAFIKVLGPKLAALSPRPKLISPEASYWGALWGYGDAILQDSTASSFTDIIATHDYAYATPTHAPITKPIWETEVSSFDGPSTDIGNGITVATWIHRAIVTGSVSAWHYWWLIGQNADNEGLINPGNVPTKRLYTVGNFSKFVRPGFELVGVTGPVPAGVSVSAYLNPANGAIVIVAINQNAGSTPISLFAPGTHNSATPWVTSATDDLAAKTALPVSSGHFSTSLTGTSVTTFVVP